MKINKIRVERAIQIILQSRNVRQNQFHIHQEQWFILSTNTVGLSNALHAPTKAKD